MKTSNSTPLAELIRQEIENAGSYISFARFMELALYAPKLGYYCSPTPKFGKQGDFITSPELSSLFTQSTARQCQQVLEMIDGGDILELGAGSGRFASDLLLELEKLNSLPHQYLIFEKSPALQLQQQTLLQESCGHLMDRIHWLRELPTTRKIKGLIIANEVIDAMPIHCFRIEEDGIKERCVTVENEQFTWTVTPPTTAELTRRVNLILQECPIEPGYESEVNLELYHWIPQIADALETGVILFLDYGYGRREYYHPDRSNGTLMCYSEHHRHDDPFQLIGLQDITAHVDFTAVVESAIDANLMLGGYTTQSSFLLACGLLELTNQSPTSIDYYHQTQAIKKLTLPSQMGESIKVMALTKNISEPLLGFSLSDRRRNL